MDGTQPLTDNTGANQYGSDPIIGYRRRQTGCIGILMLIGGILGFLGGLTSVISGEYGNSGNLVSGIIWIIISLSMIWIQVEDRGDYILLTTGPCRWALCGMGKEKIFYRNIKDYAVTQTCFYGFGLPHCSSIKLFNNCSCCCGGGNYCGHKTVRLTINERPQGMNAGDSDDCCWESCCLSCCCGERGHYIGKCCCFQPCFNPCNANCCAVNTVFVSTNDPQGLITLLNQKVHPDGLNQVQYANI
eukprot:31038_1